MRNTLAIIGIVMGFMGMGLSFSLINANLESIRVALDASILQLQWIINVYGIFIASTLVAMGRLGDIFGRKKIYLVGMVLFALAMLGGGLSQSPGSIIGFQVIWGLAGAIMLPISQALLVDIFPDEKKSMAMGIWNSGGGIALSIGPLIGGIILSFLSWRWIFLFNIPFIFVGFSLAALFAKESRSEGVSKKVDWAGVFLLMFAIGSFVLATVQSRLWSFPLIVSLYLFSLINVIALLIVEKRVEAPILREDLFRSRKFLLCCVIGFATIAIFWSEIFLLPFFIQKQLNFSPLEAGFLLLGFAFPIVLLSPLSGHLYQKIAPKWLIALGFFSLILSNLMQLGFGEFASSFYVASAIALIGIGFSLIMTPTLSAALSTISRNFAGVASGTYVTLQEIGGSVGLAISVTIARSGKSFGIGFHNALWAVLLFSCLGFVCALMMKKQDR